MAVTYRSPSIERVFIQGQNDARTIPATANAWNDTAAKLLRVSANGLKLAPVIPLTPVPWKTGTRSPQPGIVSRKSATWSLPNLPIIPSGTPGVGPDFEPLLWSIFGQTGSVSANNNVTYSFNDMAFQNFLLLSFAHDQANMTSRMVFGCQVSDFTFTLNGDIFEVTANGTGVFSIDSDGFSSEDTIAKGGLNAWPTEPVSPTSLGTVMSGFTGVATFDSNNMELALRAMQVKGTTGSTILGGIFQDAYPAIPVGGNRQVSVSFAFVDSDDANLANLKKKAKAKTPLDITIQVGKTAGSIVKFVMKQFQLAIPEYNDQADHVEVSFGDSPAHASAIGNIDDLTIIFS